MAEGQPASGSYSASADASAVRSAVKAILPGVLDDLEELIRIPSVSSDPQHAPDLWRSARAVEALLRRVGLSEVRVVTAGGAPAVIGRRPAPPGARTVLLYAHHDVQPAVEVGDWATDPFQPVVRDGRLYGRGAADDKGGIAAHLAALRSLPTPWPIGIVVFVEGEEEIGSPTTLDLLHEHAELLSADAIIVADSTNWTVGRPAITTSLRGQFACDLSPRTSTRSVHSGVWGGVVPDAVTALARMLASLHDDEGDVAVPGLYRSSVTSEDYTVEQVRQETGVLDQVRLLGHGSVIERLWARPSISVVGVDAPRIADATNSLVPEAAARLSVRLAPGDSVQHAQDALSAHLSARTPWGARLEVTYGDAARPASLTSGPLHDLFRRALTQAWDGVPPLDIGVGGSVPIVSHLQETQPDAAILVTAVADPDSRAHGANEGLHLEDFARCCEAEALFLLGVAEESA